MSYGLGQFNPKKIKYPEPLNRPGFLRAEPLSSARKRDGVIGEGR